MTSKLDLIDPELHEKALLVLTQKMKAKTLEELSFIFKEFGKDFTAFCKCYSVEPGLPLDMLSMNSLFCYLITIESCEFDKSLSHGFRRLFTSVKQLLPIKRLLIDFGGFDFPTPQVLMDEDGGMLGVWKSTSLVEAHRTLLKYADWNALKDEVEATPQRPFEGLFGSKRKQIEAFDVFKEDYYLDIWKDMSGFFDKAVGKSHYVGFSLFP